MKFISYSGDKSKEAAGPQDVIRFSEEEKSNLSPCASQKLYNHSPDGFQWGYGGSGPAQLALAILLDVTGDAEFAVKVHQDFKRDKIAGLGDRFILTGKEIVRWVRAKQS